MTATAQRLAEWSPVAVGVVVVMASSRVLARLVPVRAVPATLPAWNSGVASAVSANPGGRERRWKRTMVAVALIGTTAALGGLLMVGLVATITFAIRAGRPVMRARRRARAIGRELPDVADLVVVSIRAGLTPRQAIAAIGPNVPAPFDAALAEVVRRTERGESFPDALHALPEMLGVDAAEIADTIATGERYGLPIEPLLDGLAIQARTARRRADQADSRSLPVRLAFPLVTCTLPAYVLVAIVPAVLAALASLGDARP